MLIEYACSSCHATLETSEQLIGKLAICPQCDARKLVVAPDADDLGGGLRHCTIDATALLQTAWKIYYSRPGRCMRPVLIVYLIVFVCFALTTGASLSYFLTFDWAELSDRLTGDELVEMAYADPLGLVKTLVETFRDDPRKLLPLLQYASVAMAICLLVTVWLQIGEALVMLQIARGRRPSMWLLFRGSRLLAPVIVAGVLFAVIVLGGSLLLVVPGVVWAITFFPMFYLLVERRAGLLGSLSLCRKITRGNKVQLFVLALIMLGISTLGSLIPLGLGHVLVDPYLALLGAVTYLSLTGQKLVAPVKRVAGG
ncbi:MAG: DUF975 family protein [Planctomycetes bacterium]|nr:DUF975 family protein [Planctomycetota bacterium]